MARFFRWLISTPVIAASLAIFLLLGLVLLGRSYNLSKSDWSGWVQAIGSILAIAGAILIARNQHDKAQALAMAKATADARIARDKELIARTLTARNIVQVGTHALNSLKSLADARQDEGASWQVEMHAVRLDQLRSILDGFVAPGAEHVAAVAALHISDALTLNIFDARNMGGAVSEEILIRSTKRLQEAQQCLDRLISHQCKLIDICNARHLPLDRDDLA